MNTLHETLMDHMDECYDNIADYIRENNAEFIAQVLEHGGLDNYIAQLLETERDTTLHISVRHYARVYRSYAEFCYENIEEDIEDYMLDNELEELQLKEEA